MPAQVFTCELCANKCAAWTDQSKILPRICSACKGQLEKLYR